MFHNQADLHQRFKQHGIEHLWRILYSLHRPGLLLNFAEAKDDCLPLGCSKFGGTPDLPEGFRWDAYPAFDDPLDFIAQINLAEIQAFHLNLGIPSKGLLYFFQSIGKGWLWKMLPETRNYALFYSADPKSWQSAASSWKGARQPVLKTRRITFTPEISLPQPYSTYIQKLGLSEEAFDAYKNIMDIEEPDFFKSKMFGHSEVINNNDTSLEIEAELISRGVNIEPWDLKGHRKLKENMSDAEVLKESEAWSLILQLASFEDEDLIWVGDCGKANFLAKTLHFQDLNHDNTCFLVSQG
ncbi:MAG: DUF1963 domain-containing protein [Candidatus Sericytochromatia bacterium]